jgi:PKD repeat protein
MRCFRLIVLAIFACLGCSEDKVTGPDPLLPTITEITPAQLSRGRNNINGNIKGTNFSSDAQVDMGSGITIRNVNVRSTTEIVMTFDVAADATVGSRTLIVTTPAGASNPFPFQVGENRFPLAAFTVNPPSGGQNTIFTFDASGSNDPDGRITTYEWDFGDGKAASGKTVTHQYAKEGSFRVVLKVTDNQNAADRHVHDLRVEKQANQAPEARFIITPESGDSSTPFRFDATPSRDPDGQIDTYRWDFGDGTVAKGQIVGHQYLTAKVYTVTLTVRDLGGMESVKQKTVDVRRSGGGGGNTDPVAQFSVNPSSGDVNTIFNLDASASIDPDGAIISYQWNMGDGSTRTGITTQHKYIAAGTYTVKLTVSDNAGNKNSVTRSITVTN